MRELVQAIPDPALLLALEPEELAAKLLFLLRQGNQPMAHPGNLLSGLWGDPGTGQPGYPRDRREEIELAVIEAWAWLEAQGLLVPADGLNGSNGWRRLRAAGRGGWRARPSSPASGRRGCCPASSSIPGSPTRSGAPLRAASTTRPRSRP